MMIYEYEGKQYIRHGECNNCGACCLGGWVKPCPAVDLKPDGRVFCKIHERLADRDDEEVFEVSRINTTACPRYPNGPGDLFDEEIRNKCGYYFIEVEKILVACPVHECKEYSFQRWIDNVKSFTYPNFDILCVDNSPNEDFANRYKDQIPIIHIPDLPQEGEKYHFRITESMAVIQGIFLSGSYKRWFNCECDIIPPKDIIENMLYYGRDSDWIAHSYQIRESSNPNDIQQGIGCALMSRRMIEEIDYKVADSPDAWLWEVVRETNKFKTMELWQYWNVEHLRDNGRH